MNNLVIHDQHYKDYLERRRKAGFPTKISADNKLKPPISHGERFKPKLVKKIDENKIKGDGNYDLSNNSYFCSGYHQELAGLGEDPLTTVRTLRNILRKKTILNENAHKPVTAHLCRSACNSLTDAETQLMQLHESRSTAILYGEVSKAEEIQKKMEDFKESVIRETLSDLIMDDVEMKSFGVNSNWTLDRNISPRNRSPATNNQSFNNLLVDLSKVPALQPNERFNPRTSISSKKKVKFCSEKSPESMNSKKNDQHEIRRNDRLVDLMRQTTFYDEPRFDNPYDLPRHHSSNPHYGPYPHHSLNSHGSQPYSNQHFSGNEYGSAVKAQSVSGVTSSTNGSCKYCGVSGFHLLSQSGMDDHHKSECKIMNLCRYCQKVVLVPQLTEHYISRCSFLRGRMDRCLKCNLAADRTDQEMGLIHPLCRGRTAPDNAVWCPLCSVAVTESSEEWKKHLLSECYDNPRRKGPERIFDNTALEAGRPKPRVSGRFIDADKLVVALQEVQNKKKKKRIEAMAEMNKQ